ncbi:protein kinase domain-containing protein [Streptosporangium sp. NBC_01469]|uniref:protein kinase domain-containing protein n=1 Tax=Streptosporangium sp. NBC_01469 TaxID=2903898 RepID=UPI002E283FED|nr:protein kinase [Streptosporangium sp. NBC_01469]
MTDRTAGPLPVLAGRYRAVEKLGAGGMGVVWRARDELLHREVAIKEVRLDPNLPEAQRAEARERTLREARAAARLGHPSIVAVHDVVAQDGRPWIVMDLVKGRSLEQAVQAEGPLPPRRVAMIGLAVLDALALAHSRGIVHRDVKPANIMLAGDGGVLLTDFGIATLEGDVQLTSPDALIGSPGYMAPERLRGTDDGPATDLWSLAATLYTAVEGRSPFRRESSAATIGAILTQEAPQPRRAGGLAPVLMAALVKDPRLRPGESGLRAALRQVSQGLPVEPLSPFSPALPASPFSAQETAPGRPAAPRRRTGLIAGAALATVALGTAGAVVLMTAAGDPEAPATPSPTAGAGRFATLPDACSLLAGAQSRAVVPGSTPEPAATSAPEEKSFCDWGGPSEVRWLQLSLTRKAPVQAKAAPEVAHAFFVSERTKIIADRGDGLLGTTGAVRNADRVGAEAFAYDVIALDRVHSMVRFRISNLLVEVDVSQKGERPDAELRGRVLRAARQVAEKLNNSD